MNLLGMPWELPTAAQFTSLYTNLDPYGAPGVASGKYGAIVDFGNGPNDFASNVQTQYWTGVSGEDFNFFYGYPGGYPNSTLFAAWAVEAPEPSSSLQMLCGLLMAFSIYVGRRLARVVRDPEIPGTFVRQLLLYIWGILVGSWQVFAHAARSARIAACGSRWITAK